LECYCLCDTAPPSSGSGMSMMRRQLIVQCPLLAQSGHPELHCTCPLLTQSGHLVRRRLRVRQPDFTRTPGFVR
jgi:hypothetical protein